MSAAVSATKAGSLRFPRCGVGGRYGQSVSTTRRSSGTNRATAHLVAALYGYLETNKLPATGENMRKALLAVKTFELPMTGTLVVNEDHTVRKPVNLLTVQNGQFVPLATAE